MKDSVIKSKSRDRTCIVCKKFQHKSMFRMVISRRYKLKTTGKTHAYLKQRSTCKKCQAQEVINYLSKHPHKRRARIAVSNAKARGIIVKQPCEVCKTTKNIQAHHTDYRKYLQIMWLCKKHHYLIHKNNK